MEKAAVLRVKRKRGGALPAEALLLACKRLRTEPGAESSSAGEAEVEKNLFKLVATVNSEAEPVQKYIKQFTTQGKEAQFLQPSSGTVERIIQDLRSSNQARRKESRYHLVSSLRHNFIDEKDVALGANEDKSSENNQLLGCKKEKNEGTPDYYGDFQLFDIIQEEDVETEKSAAYLQKADDPDVILCNAVEMIRERLTVSESNKEAEHCLKEDDFVYDIYCMKSAASGWIENILSVQPYSLDCELVDEERLPEEIYEDEDDENNENNWRNDYPDEDEFHDESESEHEDLSDEDCSCIRRMWEKYQSEVLQEFEYDEVQELDSE